MSLNMIGNKLTSEDIELLKLEEKRRELHERIKNETMEYEERKELFHEYKGVKQMVKSISYTAAGIFDDTEFGHLLDKNNELDLKLLKKWRLGKMEEMATPNQSCRKCGCQTAPGYNVCPKCRGKEVCDYFSYKREDMIISVPWCKDLDQRILIKGGLLCDKCEEGIGCIEK